MWWRAEQTCRWWDPNSPWHQLRNREWRSCPVLAADRALESSPRKRPISSVRFHWHTFGKQLAVSQESDHFLDICIIRIFFHFFLILGLILSRRSGVDGEIPLGIEIIGFVDVVIGDDHGHQIRRHGNWSAELIPVVVRHSLAINSSS